MVMPPDVQVTSQWPQRILGLKLAGQDLASVVAVIPVGRDVEPLHKTTPHGTLNPLEQGIVLGNPVDQVDLGPGCLRRISSAGAQ
ncbi:hypothetical protein NHX12_027005 [Muraenolepis orangiensis]|uniref:Uncharacterized protein n=1 Tax=Muraenolepis orangiensis TaxID=630683 RepID=A0A9Q0ECS2_9TELE|nr:hypothetical protein NHX12_027005 [Muraenolepis orangiensis]